MAQVPGAPASTYVGNLEEVSGSGLQPDLVMVIVAISGIKLQMKDFNFSLSLCNSDFQNP